MANKKEKEVFNVAVSSTGERFLFDQEARHAQLWEFIKTNNWIGVESMLTKQVVGYYCDKVIARKDNVLEMLRSLFEKSTGQLITPAFVHKSGQTRGTLLLDATEIGRVGRHLFLKDDGSSSDYDDDGDDDDDDTEGDEEGGDETDSSGSGSGDEESEKSGSDSDDDDNDDDNPFHPKQKRERAKPMNLPDVI